VERGQEALACVAAIGHILDWRKDRDTRSWQISLAFAIAGAALGLCSRQRPFQLFPNHYRLLNSGSHRGANSRRPPNCLAQRGDCSSYDALEGASPEISLDL
jgi:hypothetical protein